MKSVRTPLWPHLPVYLLALLFYAVIIFVVQLADGIMSYIAPVYIEENVGNPLIMGLILSSSSVAGLICDTLFPNLFRARHHLFFLWNTVLIALLFPLIFLFFPQAIAAFFLAMIVWGVYFEFLMFANAFFVDAFIQVKHHALAWGILTSFRSLSLFVAPLLAPSLIDQSYRHPLYFAIILLVVSMFGILLFHRTFPHGKREVVSELAKRRLSVHQELQVWLTLLRPLWPMFIFLLVIFMLEATMMSVGVLATEELRDQSWWGGLFIAIYMLPNLFTGFVVEKLGFRFGKKRVAFVSGIIGGCLLFVATRMSSPELLVGVSFLAACFTSLSLPSAMGAIQNYVTRLGVFGGEMIGMSNAAGSIGYIIGPLLAGSIALLIGELATVGVMALVLAGVAAVNFVIVPRKVRLPQHELNRLTP